MTQVHVELPIILLIKIKHDNESDKNFVKLKLRRDTTSADSDLYGFEMDLFDNGKPEGFLLFVCKCDITLAASGTMATGTKVLYLRTLPHIEALRHFDAFSAGMKFTEPLTVETISLGLDL